MRFYLLSSVTLVGLLALAACGDDTENAGGGNTGGGNTGPAYVIDIVVDANRDGKVDPAAAEDQDNEDSWDAASGAMFLPNLDDDDEDEVRDADDTVVAAGNDTLDLSVIHLTACPNCPEDSTGMLEIDAASAPYVRIFGLNGDTWVPVLGEVKACWNEDDEVTPDCEQVTTLEIPGSIVRAGTDLVIEGRDFLRSPDGWKGYVDINYAIVDGDGKPLKSDENPDGIDTVKMRVSPWQLFGNLSPFDRVWSSEDSTEFVNGIEDATDAAGITYETYGNYGDQWTQDFMQLGYFVVNRMNEDGETVAHGMTVANARPWGRNDSDSSLPIRWLYRNYLGPDHAAIAWYKTKHTGSSFDSHGNHDLVPPYENGDEKYPLGRIIHGSDIQQATVDFYAAQLLQGPPLEVNSAWLYVGHIDEYLSYVPANTPRGWKLLIASPRLGREMLEDLSAAGNGDVLMHEGKQWINFDSGSYYSATISIDEVLADPLLLEASQDAQAFIDPEVEKVIEAIGLGEDEVIEIPFIFEDVDAGSAKYKLAYQPGTVNMLVLGDRVVIPMPFGPQVGGVDVFEEDLRDRLGTSANGLGSNGEGLEVYFTDDWDLYHRLSGEVHCGTNPESTVAPYTTGINWWETGR